ncbi:MAG: HAMP domain-containing sensor histidine kinase [Acidobacteriota bacterium]
MSPRALVAAPVVAAALLAAGLIVVALLASTTLRERDAAVREGELLRLGHDVEADLREAGPAGAEEALERFCAAHADKVTGIEIAGPSGTLASSGLVGGDAVEIPLALGPAWRGVAGGPGFGFGMGHGGNFPMRARLHPTAQLGSAGSLARAVTIGSIIAALALLTFSYFATAGLLQRQRLAAAEAEQHRLQALATAGAGLAHRIRNPLAAIKGTAQLLTDELAPPGQERAQRIVDASLRIETFISRLLDFARPPEVHAEELDLAEVARAVAARAGPRVEVVETTPCQAIADREHAEGILEELVANARAFDPDGVIEIALRGGGVRVIAEVGDRGPGLSIDSERAFDPYVTTRPEGTGLGLAIVRALARANRGDVSLRARAGGGSTARLSLPAARRS